MAQAPGRLPVASTAKLAVRSMFGRSDYITVFVINLVLGLVGSAGAQSADGLSFLVVLGIVFVASAAVYSAVAHFAVMDLTGRPCPLKESFAHIRSKIKETMLIWIVVGGIYAALMVLLLILLLAFEHSDLFLVLPCLWFFLFIFLAGVTNLALPIAIFDGTSSIESVRGAFALSKGNRLKIFGVSMLFMLGFFLVAVVLGLLLGGSSLAHVASALVSALALTIGMVTNAAVYCRLRGLVA